MKRFEYRLDSILRVRAWQKRQAEMRVVSARKAMHEAEAEVSRCRGKWRDSGAQLVVHAKAGLSLATLMGMQQRTRGLEQNLTNAEKNLRIAHAEFLAASSQHRKLAVVVEALTKNRAESFETAKRENSRKEQILRDERVLQRWISQSAESTESELGGEPWES